MKRHFLATLYLCVSCSLVQAAELGSPVPNCPAMSADKLRQLDFAAFKGKVLLIDFWATWCPPCRKAMPFLDGLRNEYQKAGFEVVGINVDEDTDAALEYLKTAPVDYPNSFDSHGECPRIFDVKAMPSSYIVDRQGNLHTVHLGFRDEDQDSLRKQISALLGE